MVHTFNASLGSRVRRIFLRLVPAWSVLSFRTAWLFSEILSQKDKAKTQDGNSHRDCYHGIREADEL